MRPRKILFLTLNVFSLTGGIEKVCRCLARVLSLLTTTKRLEQATLLAMHDKKKDKDSNYTGSVVFQAFQGARVRFAFKTILSGKKVQIVLLSHINLLVFGWLIKKIWPSKRIILIAHGIEVWSTLPGWKKRFLQKETEIWAVSEFTKVQLMHQHQIPFQNIVVLNNCLDPFMKYPENFSAPTYLLDKYKLRKQQPVLFTLTRLSSSEGYKGYDKVLEALTDLVKSYPDIHYIIGGKADPSEQKRMTELIAKNNLENHVTLAGFIPDEDLIPHFILGKIFIMPSTMEGFGIVFIEAAACGAKVIGGNVDGSTDALLAGELGLLTNPMDPRSIREAIEQQLNSDRSPQEIQQQCLRTFNFDSYKEKVEKLLFT